MQPSAIGSEAPAKAGELRSKLEATSKGPEARSSQFEAKSKGSEVSSSKLEAREQKSEVTSQESQGVTTELRTRPSRLRRIVEADWAPGLLIFFFDVVCWLVLYGSLAFLRNDVFYSSGLELVVIDGLQLLIIVQCLFIIGSYSSRTDMRSLNYTAEHIIAMIAALALSALAIYAAAAFDHVMRPSRSAVLVSFMAFTPLSLFYRRLLASRLAKASATRAFLVIGAGEIAANFCKTYRSSPNQQRLEFVDVEGKRAGEPIAGPGSPLVEGDLASKLSHASRRYSGIILAEGMEHISPDILERLIRTQFQRTRVYTLESFYEAEWKCVPVHSVDPFWPLQTGFQQLARTSPYHYVKRLFDIVASLLLLVICSPLMVVIGILIRLIDGWPVIFKQQRVGRDEHVFTMYKFRTMRHAADATASETVDQNSIYTAPNDPRVSSLGRWLRKLRLDELPQLWNVLNGELSLIGPRAEWVECADRYRKKIPFYHFRHLVKPGITGWAQVNYPYGESDEDAVEKLKYDLYYIRHYSLTLDAMIVLKTIYTMLFGKGR